MIIKKLPPTSRRLKLAIASAVTLSAVASAQDYSYIVHKPTGLKFYSCSSSDGTAVIAASSSETSHCAQWEQVSNGSYFHIKNRESGKYIRPASSSNGATIQIQPNSWTGNWTQWQYEDRGAGFGHLVNRASGKFVYIDSAGQGANLQQQPSSWRGDYTQWAFEAISDPTPEPTASPTSTPTPTNAPTAEPTATPTPTSVPTAEPTVTPTTEPTPIPTDAPQPNSEKVEAESGSLYGTAATYNDGAASGGQGVAYISEVGSGFSLTNVPASNEIVVTYASENSGQISLLVNGNDAGNLSFNSTGAWVGNYTSVELNIDIPENATFDIVYESGDAALNVDFIEFNYTVVEPTPTPEPTATPCASCPTPTPSPTPDPGNCGTQDVDGPADLGEGYAFGMTTGGLVYHRAVEGHTPSFAILGLQSAGANLPDTGPYEFIDNTLGTTYQRYETQVANVVEGQTYTLEIRLQGIGDGGQCIHNINVQPGQGETSSPCFPVSSGGGGVDTPKPIAGMVITNPDNADARLTGGSASAFPGYALYTTTGSCTGGCLDTWPMLTIANPDNLIGAGGVTGTFDTVAVDVTTQDDCGNDVTTTYNQVTYNGERLYFYAGDNSEDSTAGANIPGWDLADAKLIPQMELIRNPMPALPTPISGLTPGSHGYVIDLDGSSITVRAGLFFQFLVHPTTYADGVGDQLTPNLGDNDFQMWCSNNQIQWHKGDLDPVAHGQFEGIVPGECYGDYYYFFRFEKRGPTTGDPGTIWTYSGLFTTAGDRIDPRTRPSKTLRGANWMRFRHPHPPDGRTEAIGDAIANSSLLAGLARFTMETVDSGSGLQINPSIGVIRIEALENGHQPNVSPIYNYNKGTCCGTDFDYGNVVTFEITAVAGGISSQTYSTHLDAVVGVGFENGIGDPRLNLAGRAGTWMVLTDNGPGRESEKQAVFTQHVPSLTEESQVDNFLLGFFELHEKSHGADRCGNCHFMDGRGSNVVQTDNGPRIPPPLYGVGLLEYIEGAQAKLTWDGDVNTVVDQVHNALRNDHGVNPSSLGNALTLIEDYTRFLAVPNRRVFHIDQPGVAEGQVLFHQVGCADCHWENQRTRSDAPEWARDIVISPFSDMRTHDIGTGGSFRTAPLWGIGTNMELPGASMAFLHDGRASSVSAAINAHGGEASQVMSQYNSLSGEERSNIVKFIETL